MRNGLSVVLMAAALAALALSSTGCSLIGLAVGSLKNPTSVDVILEDGSSLRGEYATLDTVEASSEGGSLPAAWTEPRGLVVPGEGDEEPTWLGFNTLRRIEGDHGHLSLLLDDGTEVRAGAATVDLLGAGPDSARAEPAGQPGVPRTLLLARQALGQRVMTYNYPSGRWEEETRFENIRVPVDRLREIKPHRGHSGTWWGLGIGVLLDAVIVTAFAASGGIMGN